MQAPSAIVCTNMEAVRVAAIGGLGIAWAPDFLVGADLQSGVLVEVLSAEATEGSFTLLWPSGRHASPRLRALLDFVTSRLFQPRSGEM